MPGCSTGRRVTSEMRPLAEFPAAARARIRCVLTDIDDTLTDDGRLTSLAYGALERLQGAGLEVIPVTGRPAGWCDLIARFWPVDGVVGENGAFAFVYDRRTRRMIRHYWKSPGARARDREKLDALASRILAEVPGAAVAADQAWREADLAIDYREDIAPLPPEAVARIVELFEAAGAHAKVSSIHVNGWFGDYDKRQMTLRVLQERFGSDPETLHERVVFVGDSPNDAPLFACFANSVGVANVRDFEGRLGAEPTWVAEHRGGAGFAELADALLAAHR